MTFKYQKTKEVILSGLNLHCNSLMKIKSLIFSNKLSYRIQRHLLFWLLWLVFLFANWNGVWHADNIRELVQHDLLAAFERILPQMLFCYFVIYFIIPIFFLSKRLGWAIVLLIISFLAFYYFQYLTFALIDPNKIMGLESDPRVIHRSADYKILAFYMITDHSGAIVCCAVIGSLKFLKFWYIKQQENVVLRRENAVAELQLLKAQVHPHFLFNTLNNIYSFSLSKSPLAGDLIEKLSGMLRYMILEGQKTFVPLKKEIQLIQDYISLEKVRYGERLDIAVNISGNCDNKFIAPLLMIPFVENSFKHGSSKLLTNPKVNLSIIIEEAKLIFMLRNNKPNSNTQERQSDKGGIGLKNAAKRLQLLYPDKHNLKIESTDDSFYVYMHIMLTEMKEENLENSHLPATPQTLSYASP